MQSDEIESRVRAIVAEALDVPLDRVTPHASLIDDLGAESIDFLDILFRVEHAFGVKIPEHDMWQGSFESTDDDGIRAGLAGLKARWPAFAWDRLPARLTRDDLPRLITTTTIVEYLAARLGGPGPA